MKVKSIEDNFINKLLEETYRSIPESEMSKASKDLLAYFNEQGKAIEDEEEVDTVLLNYLQQNGLSYFSLKKDEDIGCFAFDSTAGTIHFPYNWSFFKDLHSAAADNESFIHYVNKTNDSELLLEVLNIFNYPSFDLVLLNHEELPMIIYLPEGKQSSFDWLKNFLGINQNIEKKAA